MQIVKKSDTIFSWSKATFEKAWVNENLFGGGGRFPRVKSVGKIENIFLIFPELKRSFTVKGKRYPKLLTDKQTDKLLLL